MLRHIVLRVHIIIIFIIIFISMNIHSVIMEKVIDGFQPMFLKTLVEIRHDILHAPLDSPVLHSARNVALHVDHTYVCHTDSSFKSSLEKDVS